MKQPVVGRFVIALSFALGMQGCGSAAAPQPAGPSEDGEQEAGAVDALPAPDAGAIDANASPDPDNPDATPPVDAAGTGPDAAVDDSPKPPGVGLLHTAEQLQFMRDHKAQPPWDAAYQQVLDEAEGGLSRTPVPTADFNIPFYYADPTASQAAKEGLRQDALAAYALALGYQLADTSAKRSQYASKAVEILDAWATVNKSVSGSDGNLVVIYTGVPLLYAADLVMNYEGWDAAERSALLGWVTSVFLPSSNAIKNNVNNWGDWGTLGAVASDGLLKDTSGVVFESDRIKQRIETEIADNGELPEENKRTNSGMWYTFFAMTSMTTASQIVLNVTGENLFAYSAPNGRSIKLALDKEFFYALHPDQWPYPLPDGAAGQLWKLLYPCDDTIQLPSPNGWPGSLFEVMSDVYQVSEWEGYVKAFRPQHGYHGFIYSTLMRETP
jgi:Alginate lyase